MRSSSVKTHLEPLAIATNILQSSRTRLDHVLLTLGNLYYVYSSSAFTSEVRDHMLGRLEFRWGKGAKPDHDVFILAVILNPYVRATCFNREKLSGQDIINLTTAVFKRLFLSAPGPSFVAALEQYLEWQGEYSSENMGLDEHLNSALAQHSVWYKFFGIISRNSLLFRHRMSMLYAYGGL